MTTQELMWQDAILPSNIAVHSPFAQQDNAYLLTGTSGFVGGYLLAKMLALGKQNLYCLVRSKTQEEGYAKIKQNLLTCGVWEEAYENCFIALVGDTSLPNLGLPTAVYEKLSQEIDVIQHVASHTSWVLPYEKMRANITSTLEIIQFATHHKTKRINYTSSKAMFGSFDIPAKSDIEEGIALEDIQNVVSGYGQSKWVMECLFRKARTLGLPVNILHLGFITPHSYIKSEVGENFLTNFIVANAVHGITALHDYNIAPLPVDFLVDMLIKLGEDVAAETKTYQFENPEASYWQEVAEFIQDNTRFQMKLVTDNEWLEYIYANI